MSKQTCKLQRTEQNKPEKRIKYIKAALQIAKKGTPKNRMAKEQDRSEKANKYTYPITP